MDHMLILVLFLVAFYHIRCKIHVLVFFTIFLYIRVCIIYDKIPLYHCQNGQNRLFLAIFSCFCSGTDWTWVVHTFSHPIFYIIPIYSIIGHCTNHFRNLKCEITAKTLKIANFGHFCSGTDWTWVVHTFSHHILYIFPI